MAEGLRAAHSMAVSRSGTSMTKKPPNISVVSAWGPFWICCFPSRMRRVVAVDGGWSPAPLIMMPEVATDPA